MTGKSPHLKRLIVMAAPVAALVAGLWWLNAMPSRSVAGIWWLPALTARASAEFTYETKPATRGAIRKVIATSGPVRALVTVQVGSQLSGQIQEIRADFNAEVKAGDVLAVLDAKTLEARLEQARADLEMAEAALANQEASQLKAEAVLRQAERSIGRQQALATKGITAQATLDTATRDADIAKAEIQIGKAQLASAKANIAQRRAALKQAQIDLDRTRIRAPIDGTIVSRSVDIGQTVAASLQAPELFRIAQDLRRIRIEAQVNEADVGAVAEGNPVVFTVDAYPGREFRGHVSQVRLAATEVQNVVTYTVIVEAVNNDRKLFPGMTANVQIESARREQVLRVPAEALRYRPRGLPVARTASAPDAKAGEGERGTRAEREERMLARFQERLGLTPEQLGLVRATLAQQATDKENRRKPKAEEARSEDDAQSRGGEVKSSRPRRSERVERSLLPILTDEQKLRLENFKKGRDGTRSAVVWVLGPGGAPEARQVRLGLADSRFAEVSGGTLREGELLVVRSREVGK